MQPSNGTGLTLAILTTAIAATAGGSAQAALVSEAPLGFTPVTVTATAGSYTFDVDGNGSNDFTIVGNGSDVYLNYLNAPTSGAQTFAGTLTGQTNSSSLAIGNVKMGTSAVIGSNFGTGVGEFAALATDATFSAGFASGGTLGYLQGTYTGGDISSFQLLDFGLVNPSAVPEPASLALLATGAAGIAALRRRRAATGQRKAA